MEDEQCKQTERFSVMTKGSGYFLSWDDKSKQRYKTKICNIQGYDPHQIKKEEPSGDISKFPPVHWHGLFVLVIYLFSLSPLTKEELKA